MKTPSNTGSHQYGGPATRGQDQILLQHTPGFDSDEARPDSKLIVCKSGPTY